MGASADDHADDHAQAAELAEGAGQVLLRVREELGARGATPRELKEEGDRRAHVWLVGQLAEHRPDDAVLSEEATANEVRESRRLDSPRVWIIDPLDGTREFGEGRADWAVHVALVVDGVPVAGAVALPAQGVTFRTGEPPRVPVAPRPPERLRVVVSRTRPPRQAIAIAAAMDAVLVEMGSAGAKAMSIIQGDSDLYPHSGGQYEWDSCAPVAVALAAGLHCSRLDGSPLLYNRPDPYLPDLLICRPDHAEAAIAAAASA